VKDLEPLEFTQVVQVFVGELVPGEAHFDDRLAGLLLGPCHLEPLLHLQGGNGGSLVGPGQGDAQKGKGNDQ
jgi:hypothetical protein